MKILFTSLGTRGDVEPLIAMAEILNRNGHEAICAFSEQFRSEVESVRLPFVSLGSEFTEVLNSKFAKSAFGGTQSRLHTLYAYFRLALLFIKSEKATIESQYNAVKKADPDLIVHNRIAVYPFVWELDHPGRTILVFFAPYILHDVHDHTFIDLDKDYGPFINKLTYKWARYFTAVAIKKAMKHLKIKRNISKHEIIKSFLSTRALYTVSNSLFPKPEYWGESLSVMGFFERQKEIEWNPPLELNEFLSRHEKILLISFGSMTNSSPDQKTKIILDILQENKIPAIIVTASGGLVRPQEYNQNLLYFTKTIPYNQILPRIYGVIHHGGSGTVHNSLKHGCASMAIPHFVDQFIWNNIIHEKRLGPKGIKINRLNKDNMEPLILDLYHNPVYRENAEKIAIRMKEESSEQRLCEFILGEKL